MTFASDQVARLFRARAGVATVFFLNGFGWGNWVPRIAEIQTKLAASDGQLGLALFMAALGAVFAMPLAGAAAHRYGSRTATAVTVACYGLSLPLLALAPDLIGLGFALLLVGAASGALDVSDERAGSSRGEALLASDHVVAAWHVQPRGHGGCGGDRPDRHRWPAAPASFGRGLRPAASDQRDRVSPHVARRGRGGRRRAGFCPTIARHPVARHRGARRAAVRGRHGRLECGVPERQPRRRHHHGGGGLRGVLDDHGGRPLHRRPSGRPARRRSGRARRRRARCARSLPQSGDRRRHRRGDWFRSGRRRPVVRVSGGAVVRRA